MISFRHVVYSCCVPLIIAGIYGYLTYNKLHLPHLLDAETLAKTSDSRIFDVHYRQYNLAGILIHFLETPLITHTPENNTHLLTTPHIFVMESDQEPWEIHAHYATATQGGKQINFSQHVRIKQKKQGNHAATLLATEDLTYFPSQKKASTTRDVVVTQAGNQIRSTGLIADLTTNTVHLLSNARGHYVQSTG
jgi:lipopolysaccharide export system protein LptC